MYFCISLALRNLCLHIPLSNYFQNFPFPNLSKGRRDIKGLSDAALRPCRRHVVNPYSTVPGAVTSRWELVVLPQRRPGSDLRHPALCPASLGQGWGKRKPPHAPAEMMPQRLSPPPRPCHGSVAVMQQSTVTVCCMSGTPTDSESAGEQNRHRYPCPLSSHSHLHF